MFINQPYEFAKDSNTSASINVYRGNFTKLLCFNTIVTQESHTLSMHDGIHKVHVIELRFHKII